MAWANAALLLLYPLAWLAPMIETQVFWVLGGGAVSLVEGLGVLWGEAPVLAALVTLLAVVMPYAKVVLTQIGFARPLPRALSRALTFVARLSMADIFLIALTIVVVKGVSGAAVAPLWGFWLFTACVLASLVISWRKT